MFDLENFGYNQDPQNAFLVGPGPNRQVGLDRRAGRLELGAPSGRALPRP